MQDVDNKLSAISNSNLTELQKSVLRSVFISRRLEETLIALVDRSDFTIPNAFRIFDRDGKNNIDLAEFSVAFGLFEVYPSEKALEGLFNKYDLSGEKSLTETEFRKMLAPKDIKSKTLLLCRPYLPINQIGR